jgi:hypothetical protein
LGLVNSCNELKSRYRRMALKNAVYKHPDKGGNPEAFKRLGAAYDEAYAVLCRERVASAAAAAAASRAPSAQRRPSAPQPQRRPSAPPPPSPPPPRPQTAYSYVRANYMEKDGPEYFYRPMNANGPEYTYRPMNANGPEYTYRPMNANGPEYSYRPMNVDGPRYARARRGGGSRTWTGGVYKTTSRPRRKYARPASF